MRHLTKSLLLLSLSLGLVSVAGCDSLNLNGTLPLLNPSKVSSLKVYLGGDLVQLRKTLATVDDIDHVSINLKNAVVDQTQTLTKAQLADGGATGGVTFSNLTPGTANVTGTVYDADGLVLGEKQVGVSLVSGETATASLNIQLIPEIDHPAVPPATTQANLSITNGSIINNGAVVTTLAGNGTSGYAEGTGSAARFYQPGGVAVDNLGNAYVADSGNSCIRKISSTGVTSLLASGSVDGEAIYASTVAVDLNRSRLYYVNFTYGELIYTGLNGGTKTRLGTVSVGGSRGMTVDRWGNVYVAQGTQDKVLKIAPTGDALPFAGSTVEAGLSDPQGVAADSAGNVYIADTGHHRILKVTASGAISTFAGSGVAGFNDATGTAAQFNHPAGLACDSNGSVYVADFNNTRIRKISRTGVVTTIAGQGNSALVDGTGGNAKFGAMFGLAVDANGKITVADTFSHAVRRIQ